MSGYISKVIPMPISRPSGLGEEYLPTIASRMPLERPTEVTDAFKSIAGGVVAPDDKSISWGFLEAWGYVKDTSMELYNQLNTGMQTEFIPNSGVDVWMVVLGALIVAFVWVCTWK